MYSAIMSSSTILAWISPVFGNCNALLFIALTISSVSLSFYVARFKQVLPLEHSNVNFIFVAAILATLSPKTNHMFHQTGKMRSTPSCPVQLVANFNPGTGSQSYKASGKSCSRPSHYRLPFYLKDMGPRYNAISVAAHEARPGHHTQVILLLQKIVRRYNSCLNVTKYKVRLSNLSLLSNYSQLSDWITGEKKLINRTLGSLSSQDGYGRENITFAQWRLFCDSVTFC